MNHCSSSRHSVFAAFRRVPVPGKLSTHGKEEYTVSPFTHGYKVNGLEMFMWVHMCVPTCIVTSALGFTIRVHG